MAHPSLPVSVPHSILATSPVRNQTSLAQRRDIPLHLLALIISYVDDVADIARLTRTSRLLYYMTLPKLYENVTLHAYAELRYTNGRPEGYGSGSPFAMGLNALVSRNFTNYVQKFRLIGEWRESDIDDYAKGRVPDNSMMLNIAIRAALDKMEHLKSFGWELNTKPMQTIYQSLTLRPSLVSLTLRFPSRRTPRPTVIIPTLPNLKCLTAYDMDPLCYPDDISLLLATCKKLEDLKLHWSPRMRDIGEESVSMMTYFGRCLTARHTIRLKRLAFFNLYTRNSGDFDSCVSNDELREVTLINCVGSGDPMTVFLDETWRMNQPSDIPKRLTMLRGDMIDRPHVTMLARFEGLERLYLVNAKRNSRSKSNSAAVTPATPSPSTSSPSSNSLQQEAISLASDYLAAIQSHHRTIRHLLLSDQWALSCDVVRQLLQDCPKIEQLGVALGVPELTALREVMPFAPNLFALRILVRPSSELWEKIESMDEEMHAFVISQELWRPEYKNIKWFGLAHLVYELGPIVNMGKKRAKPDGEPRSMRIVRQVPREKVKDIEIWSMDSCDM
ncbi:hypothetical protein AOQ84DRAFT_333724 [Glonium stellatum]|uniref:F-box domain-containing protein n=1 Tax=Glonium stellatum TaxID=574774 RepID=A0A8E2F972_9PEZI|nr:hypothetical protein AOQ84DRAFT_333724 [Glonium stellatum]